MQRKRQNMQTKEGRNMAHLTETANGDTMRTVAVHVADENVRGVGFERWNGSSVRCRPKGHACRLTDAIIFVVNGRVGDGHVGGPVDIPSICQGVSGMHN